MNVGNPSIGTYDVPLLATDVMKPLPNEEGTLISNQEEKNKRLLMELFQLKKTTYYGPLLLKLACGVNFSNLATVRFFLKCGVDPNSGDPYGNGPLHDLLQCNRMIREWDLYKRDDYAIVRLLLANLFLQLHLL